MELENILNNFLEGKEVVETTKMKMKIMKN